MNYDKIILTHIERGKVFCFCSHSTLVFISDLDLSPLFRWSRLEYEDDDDDDDVQQEHQQQ